MDTCEEDTVCDHCNSEIEEEATPSGWTKGEMHGGRRVSGWMHRNVKTCKFNLSEEAFLRRFEGDEPLKNDVPPARKGG